MRMNIARKRPVFRARSRSAAGSLPARIEMKTMLSMPRTISRTVSVRRAIQPSAPVIHSTFRDSRRAHPRSRGPATSASTGTASTSSAGKDAASVLAAAFSFSASGGCMSSSAMRPSSWRDAQRVEKCRHHRALMRQVIRDEQTGGNHLRHGRKRQQLPRLLLDRHAHDALDAELDALRDRRHRFGLLDAGVLVVPERFGGLELALRRQLFPELRGTRNRDVT